MVEFLRKFVNRDTKINRVNSIIITESINLQLFTLMFYGVGVRCDRSRLSVLSPFIEKFMAREINAYARDINNLVKLMEYAREINAPNQNLAFLSVGISWDHRFLLLEDENISVEIR